MSYPKCVAAVVAVCSCLAFHSPLLADLRRNAEAPAGQSNQAVPDAEPARVEAARGYNRVIGLINGKPVLGAEELRIRSASFKQIESKRTSNTESAAEIRRVSSQCIEMGAEQFCRKKLMVEHFEATATPEEKQAFQREFERAWAELEEKDMKVLGVSSRAELEQKFLNAGNLPDARKAEIRLTTLARQHSDSAPYSPVQKNGKIVAYAMSDDEELTTLRIIPGKAGNVIEMSNEMTNVEVAELGMKVHGRILEVKIVGGELELRDSDSAEAPALRWPAIKLIVSDDDWIATATK